LFATFTQVLLEVVFRRLKESVQNKSFGNLFATFTQVF